MKAILESWWSAGLFTCALLGLSLWLYPPVSYGSAALLQISYTLLWLTALFIVPSTVLNWLYCRQNYSETQRYWMRVPKTIFGKAGYIMTGAIALWFLLGLGIGLAGFVIWGLMSLGQATWST